MARRPTTPKKISGQVRRFLKSAGLAENPQFLPFTQLSERCRASYCLDNCERESEALGLEIVFGWVIWELKRDRFIEAEFHAVLEQHGKLLDITPRVDGEKRILFVRDSTRKAVRVGPRTWRTWSNLKSANGELVVETRQIEIVDVGAAVL